MAQRDTSFSYSFLVLPRHKREAIVTVWDFCRAVDDAVDKPVAFGAEAGGRVARGAPTALWRAEVAACFGSAEPATSQGRALKPLVKTFGFSRQPFDDLVDGVAMDVTGRRYETFDELHQYCLRVASAVGLICLDIFGARASRDYAINLGVALQLTNIIRDVAGDLAQGRVYLPLEDLRRFGCRERDLQNGHVTPEVRELMRFECARARDFYRRAAESLPREEARLMVAARIMAAIYFALLRRIERRDYDVFSTVIRVPRPTRALIAAKVWAESLVGM